VRRGRPVGLTPLFSLLLLLPLGLLLVGRLAPAAGVGADVRLAGAVGCLLLLPGAGVLSLLGWPGCVSVAFCALILLSLASFAFGLAVALVAGRSLALAGVVALAPAAFLSLRRSGFAAPLGRAEILTGAALLGVGVAAGLALAHHAGPLTGDALFHLGRARKLAELDSLSLRDLGEFRDGDLHPGYAFPLWQAFIAIVARLADMDVVAAGARLGVVLVPVALVCAYAAGRALLGSRRGGLAVSLAYLAVFDFGGEFSTSFRLIGFPIGASVLILVPAALGLVFWFMAHPRRNLLVSLAAAGVVLAAAHPTYAPFLCIVLAGFVGVALLDDVGTARSLAVALGVFAVGSALVLAWFWSIAPPPAPGSSAGAAAHYAERLARVGSSFVLEPSTVLRQQGAVLALLTLPLVLFASPRVRAFVVGGTLLVAICLFVPPVLKHIADAVSLSQALRLRYFLPLPFALAAAAIVFAGRGTRGVVGALALGAMAPVIAADIVPTWAALPIAAAIALFVAARTRARPAPRARVSDRAALACTILLTLPTLAVGATSIETHEDPDALTRGLIQELAAHVAPGDVILAPPVTAYRALAFVPAYAVAVPLTHVAQTARNHALQRIRDASRFFVSRALGADGRARLLKRYGVRWVLEDLHRPHDPELAAGLRLAYADDRYRLFETPMQAWTYPLTDTNTSRKVTLHPAGFVGAPLGSCRLR
jgi:hypothetical protein